MSPHDAQIESELGKRSTLVGVGFDIGRFEVLCVTGDIVPGEVRTGEGPVRINEGRETADVTVANTGDRPVQVGSHFHFFEANAALEFDRARAFGMRLDIPAGTAVRFEPGDETTVDLVAIGGKRVAHGMNGLVNGSVDGDPAAAVERAREQGFGGIPAQAGTLPDEDGREESATDHGTGTDEEDEG